MFIDQVKIVVQAGHGGDGAVSFHREKYVSRGGPDGGDGGKGGDIIFRATRNKNTLVDFRFQRKFQAQNGENGRGNNQTGAKGADMVIDVPEGTIVRDLTTMEILLDLFEDGQEKVLIRGTNGGKGNARFATPTRQAPRFALPGRRTEPIEVLLELRTIADVGLVGLPNVGKSTLLSVLTSAKPKIANYHFTTLSPNLGVVKQDDYSFVLADIPGLIEGASEGAGLGHAFLKHVERTRLLVHVVDISSIEGRNPVEDFHAINRELAQYSQKLADLPQIVAANKTDLPSAQEYIGLLKEVLDPLQIPVFEISAATAQGLTQLIRATVKALQQLPPVQRYEEKGELQLTDRTAFEITVADGLYLVDGPLVQDILRRTNPNDSQSMRFFQQILRKAGIIGGLKERGAQDGDTVVMGEWEFDFVD